MRVFIDFETYWDPDNKYGLKSMKTEEYVRDSRFHAFGCGVQIGEDEPVFIPSDKLEALFGLPWWGEAEVIAHNMVFDGFVLTERFGVRAKRYVCTKMLVGLKDGIGYSSSLDAACDRRGLGRKIEGVLEGIAGVRHPSAEQDG